MIISIRTVDKSSDEEESRIVENNDNAFHNLDDGEQK